VLGPIIGGLIAVHYRKTRRGEGTALLAKALTVAWLAPMLLAAIFADGFVLLLVVAVVLTQSNREYSRLAMLERPYAWMLQLYSLGGLLIASTGNRTALLEYPLGLVAATFVIPVFSQRIQGSHECIAGVIFAYFYISFPMSLILFIRNAVSWGLQFLVIVGIGTAIADAGAFVIGSKFRGPRLAPAVSPMKTWSGTFGSFVGAAVGVALAWRVAPRSWHLLVAFLITCCVAVAATFGDLSESVIKRSFDQKDTGTILAGFGGFLDRFDSFLFTIPAAFVILSQALHVHG
jgi:phosphatidate cytidylyltransferase